MPRVFVPTEPETQQYPVAGEEPTGLRKMSVFHAEEERVVGVRFVPLRHRRLIAGGAVIDRQKRYVAVLILLFAFRPPPAAADETRKERGGRDRISFLAANHCSTGMKPVVAGELLLGR